MLRWQPVCTLSLPLPRHGPALCAQLATTGTGSSGHVQRRTKKDKRKKKSKHKTRCGSMRSFSMLHLAAIIVLALLFLHRLAAAAGTSSLARSASGGRLCRGLLCRLSTRMMSSLSRSSARALVVHVCLLDASTG